MYTPLRWPEIPNMMCWLQGLSGDQAELAAAPVPTAAEPTDMASPPGRPSMGVDSLGSGASERSQEQWPQQPPAGEHLEDWPILREGEGGKLVRHPLLTACKTWLWHHGSPSSDLGLCLHSSPDGRKLPVHLFVDRCAHIDMMRSKHATCLLKAK